MQGTLQAVDSMSKDNGRGFPPGLMITYSDICVPLKKDEKLVSEIIFRNNSCITGNH